MNTRSKFPKVSVRYGRYGTNYERCGTSVPGWEVSDPDDKRKSNASTSFIRPVIGFISDDLFNLRLYA